MQESANPGGSNQEVGVQCGKQQAVGPGGTAPPKPIPSLNWARMCVYLGAMAVFMDLAMIGQQQTPSIPHKPPPAPEASGLPDANKQMEMREQRARKQNFEAANIERKRQIDEDSARLLKLAADLSAEVDSTSKEMFSDSAIRRADEIERLARNVKEKMKLTVGGA